MQTCELFEYCESEQAERDLLYSFQSKTHDQYLRDDIGRRKGTKSDVLSFSAIVSASIPDIVGVNELVKYSDEGCKLIWDDVSARINSASELYGIESTFEVARG